MYWGYIIFSNSNDKFYVGTTGVGVETRVDRHDQGWTKSTKSGIPWELKNVRSFDSKNEALKWERIVKKQKSRSFIKKLIDSEENEFGK